MAKTSLDQLTNNETANVVGFASGTKNVGRLLSFGLMPGSPVTVLQNHARFSLLIMVNGMKIAIDRNEARCIEVVSNQNESL